MISYTVTLQPHSNPGRSRIHPSTQRITTALISQATDTTAVASITMNQPANVQVEHGPTWGALRLLRYERISSMGSHNEFLATQDVWEEIYS